MGFRITGYCFPKQQYTINFVSEIRFVSEVGMKFVNDCSLQPVFNITFNLLIYLLFSALKFMCEFYNGIYVNICKNKITRFVEVFKKYF